MSEADSLLDAAYELARGLLEAELPVRWKHSKAVALKASKFAGLLAPGRVDEIVAGGLMHDIGYAAAARRTGFHPVDGAMFVQRSAPQLAAVAGLIAYHTGAYFEAAERGLIAELRQFAFSDELELAILSCADLCTGPDGATVDPAERLGEVLARYGADHPVHRAIARSRPWLIAQADVVRRAAKVACVKHVGAPNEVDRGRIGWMASWVAADYQVSVGAWPGRISVRMADPDKQLDAATGDALARDIRAASAAANGSELGWNQYRASRVSSPDVAVESFRLGDVLRWHRRAMAAGYEVMVQHRAFTTMYDVSSWVDLPEMAR